MKRIISLVLMFIMLFCIVSCKRRPPDDVTTDVPAQGGTDDAEKPEDKTDAEKTEDELPEKTDDDKTDINSEKENNDEKQHKIIRIMFRIQVKIQKLIIT